MEFFQIKGRQPLTDKLLETIESSKFISYEERISEDFDLREDSHPMKLE